MQIKYLRDLNAPEPGLCASELSKSGLSRHYGYTPPVLNALKIKIEAEFNYAPRPDAMAYADGAVWDLGGVRVRAVHMPGHTAGHNVLLVEPHGIAFIGDIDLSGFGPYYGDATSNRGEFRRSLARLKELPASVWITSHHKGVLTGPRTLPDLVRQRLMYPARHEDLWVDCAEERAIAQHLDELLAAGRVVRDGCTWARA